MQGAIRDLGRRDPDPDPDPDPDWPSTFFFHVA